MSELIPADGQYDRILSDLETYFDTPGAKDLYDNFIDFQESPVFAEACDTHKLAMAAAIEGIISGESKLTFAQLNKQLFHPDFIERDTPEHDACSRRHVELYKPKAREIYANFENTDFQAITSGMYSGKSTLTILTRDYFEQDGYEIIDLVAGVMPEAFIHSRALDRTIPAKRFVKELPKLEDLQEGENLEDFMSIGQLIASLESKQGKTAVLLSEFSFMNHDLFYEFAEIIKALNETRVEKIKVISEGLDANFCDAPIIDRQRMRELGFHIESCQSFAPNQLDWSRPPVVQQIASVIPEGEKTIRYFLYTNKVGKQKFVMDFSILNVVVSKYCKLVRYNPARAGESVSAIIGHNLEVLEQVQTAKEKQDEKRDALWAKSQSPENLLIPAA
jgi:thymidine kinase